MLTLLCHIPLPVLTKGYELVPLVLTGRASTGDAVTGCKNPLGANEKFLI